MLSGDFFCCCQFGNKAGQVDSGQSGADKTHQNTDRKVKAKPQTEERTKDQMVIWALGFTIGVGVVILF